VDPYYNGPSSIEIRKEYIAPVAEAAPGIEIISYVIPGRTGAQLLPEDLALLNETYDNFNTVKEATGNLENMRKTRKCCGPDFTIMSGDDGMTFEMMSDPQIKASGVISVASNVAPKAISQMVRLLRDGDQAGAKKLLDALKPLFDLVTVKTMEQTPFGEVVCRARNPVAYKTLMSILGMPSGGCRRPLGKMTRNGLETVLKAARNVQANHPEILEPVAEFFNVDIERRLNDPSVLDDLSYATY
jgi:4-hydroxy-tetrahydrodipicolinate synthase